MSFTSERNSGRFGLKQQLDAGTWPFQVIDCFFQHCRLGSWRKIIIQKHHYLIFMFEMWKRRIIGEYPNSKSDGNTSCRFEIVVPRDGVWDSCSDLCIDASIWRVYWPRGIEKFNALYGYFNMKITTNKSWLLWISHWNCNPALELIVQIVSSNILNSASIIQAQVLAGRRGTTLQNDATILSYVSTPNLLGL